MLTGLQFIYIEFGIDSIEFLIFSCIIVICAILALSVGYLFCLHLWLIAKGLTTLEYLEKFKKGKGKNQKVLINSKNKSIFSNFKKVLGDNILTWLFPVDSPRTYEGYQE